MNTDQLRDVCEKLVMDPGLKPETFCNVAVQRVAHYYGCFDLDGLMANSMILFMRRSPHFLIVQGEDAHEYAATGKLAIAAHEYDGHGHVAAVYPSDAMFYSPSWKKAVPFLANVGISNGIKPASECFPVSMGEPIYFVYKPAAQGES